MKIFIPSWRRPTTTTTPALLDACGVPYQLVIRETEFAEYAKNFDKKKLLVVGADDALNAAREHTRTLLKKGEWCLHMDDNVLGFIQCAAKFYRTHEEVPLEDDEDMVTRAKWQPTMNRKATFSEFYDLIVQDTMEECENRGAFLAGFSAHDNPAFRYRKFTDVGYVCGKTMLMRNQGLPWIQSHESAGEDYALTAAHLYENGRVLINKWGHPMRRHYMAGGCGPYDERLPSMMRAQQDLCARYGDLFAIKNEGREDKRQGELRIRFNSLEQVEKWRAELPHDPNWRLI